MPTNTQQLLAEVVARLDDDAPRLVYADALQADGDPRGELITVQCELARLGLTGERRAWDWMGDGLVADEVLDSPKTKKLLARQNALLKKHEKAWLEPLQRFGYKAVLERGFVESVEWMPARSRTRLAELLAVAPTLRELRLSPGTTDADVAPLVEAFQGDALRQLHTLHFLTAPSAACDAFLSSTRLSGLRRLEFGSGDSLVQRLVKAPVLRQVQVLELLYSIAVSTGDRLTATTLDHVLRSCGPLRELHLRDGAIGREGAEVLAKATALEGLDVLSLLGNGVEAEGVALLAASPRLQRLRALDLRKNRVGVDGATAVGNGFGQLRVLDLTTNSLGAKGVAALVGGRGLGELRHLCLQQCAVDDEAIEALTRSKRVAQLRTLNLRSNKLTDKGARLLAECKGLSKLRALNLNNNPIGDAGKKALANSKFLEARVSIGR